MTAHRGHQRRHFETTNPVTGTLWRADQSAPPIGAALLPGSNTSRPTNRMPEWGTSGSVGGRSGNRRLYPADDGFQRPLRSRFQPRLMPSVGRHRRAWCTG